LPSGSRTTRSAAGGGDVAERPIGQRPSELASLTRWLTAGLVLTGVAMAAQRWPHLDWVLGVSVLGVVVAGLAVWAIKELLEWVKETVEDFMQNLGTRRPDRHDRR
jgi:hypothetical protein